MNEDDSNDLSGSARKADVNRDRLTKLSSVISCISESFDVEAVLQESAEAARVLTAATHGVVTTVDNPEEIRVLFSSSVSEEERKEMMSWSDGSRFLHHLCKLDEPLTHESLSRYVQSLNLSPIPIELGSFQIIPLRYRGERIGGFIMVTKSGSVEEVDLEVLALLACQTAAVLENTRVHHEAQSSRVGLDTLIETSPIGVVVIDVKTLTPLSVNAAARRILADLDLSGLDAYGLRSVTCRCSDGRKLTLDELPRAESLRSEKVEISTTTDRSVRTLLNASPIRSEEGITHTVVVTLQDLAPFEAQERDRTDFLNMVSRELREPLAAVKGSAVTVLGSSRTLDPSDVRQFFRIVEDQADRMNTLINDLLSAGRLALGNLSVSAVPTSVVELVEEARIEFLGGSRTHDIVVDLQPELPLVLADAFCVGRVLDNLFRNAAQNAPPLTSIYVSGLLDEGFVHLSVRDEGDSLDVERLTRIFMGFTEQAQPIDDASVSLSICRGLVEAHGGRIEAAVPNDGRGIQVTFTLPVAESRNNARADEPQSRKSEEKLTVLVLNDDPQSLRYIQDGLNSAGFTTVVSSELKDVPELIQYRQPQLALFDLVLPGTHGIQPIREVVESTGLPVIFVSAYGRADLISQAVEAGVADYIVKPFSSAELVARMRSVLRQRKRRNPFIIEGMTIDYEHRRVSVSGDQISLTVTEYEVLRVLSINAGRVVSFDELRNQVWREPEATATDTVRGLIRRLRLKINDPVSNPRYIFNERGVGYRMPHPDDEISSTI